jgi:Protein of unknown function (DUF3617)
VARVATTSLLVLAFFPMIALAAELPSRKPGLWEVKTSFESGNVPAQVIRQCVDASTDQMMQARSVGSSQRECSKRDVQRSGNTITIDSTCTVAGKTRTSHIVITGSFDSAYTMTLTAQGEGAPAGSRSMTMAVKWIGACAADQKHGDMIMAERLSAGPKMCTGGKADWWLTRSPPQSAKRRD